MKTIYIIIYLLSITHAKERFSPKDLYTSDDEHEVPKRYENVIRPDTKKYIADGEDKPLEPNLVTVSALGRQITGKKLSIKGNIINSFQGIKYGNFSARFKDAELISSYGKDENFLSLPNPCIQMGRIGIDNMVVGKEDCLHLNVYTPATIRNGKFQDMNLPVMVYLHGGQFVSGDTSFYLPNKLLREDVILVTVQYRLGAHGFFAIRENEDAKGNQALRDQNLALQWVSLHISDFGGNPEKITLFGEDAGAISALYHLITDYSTVYISGIIAQSGSPLQPFAYDPDMYDTSIQLAEVIGCENGAQDDGISLLRCMSEKKSAEKVARAAYFLADNRQITYPLLVPGFDNDIIKNTPFDLMKEGKYNQNISVILGTVAQEGSFTFAALSFTYLYPNELNTDADYLEEEMIHDFLTLTDIEDSNEVVSFSMKEIYLKDVNRYTMNNVAPGMIDLTGTVMVKGPILETAKLHNKNAKHNTYLYSFEHLSRRSMFAGVFWEYETDLYYNDAEDSIGVTHGDDLMYLLSLPDMTVSYDKAVEENMINLWTKFAKNQKPPSLWKPYDERQSFLMISKKSEMMYDYESRYTITKTNPPPNFNTTTTTTEGSYTTDTEIPDECEDYCQDIADDRDAYLITMIIFIILFVIALGLSVYFWNKTR